MNDPELYMKAHQHQRREAKWTLTKYIDKIKFFGHDDLVLDIGCGPGDVTWEILKPHLPLKARVVGADMSNKMLEYAKTHYPDVKYIEIDIATKNLSQELYETFHHVFSFYVFQQVENLRQAFMNIFNMLKPGGYFTTCFVTKCDVYCVYEYLKQYTKWAKLLSTNYINKFHHFQHNEDTENNLKELLTNIGFEVLGLQCSQKTFEFESMTDLRNFVKPVDSLYLQLPEHLKEEYLNDLLTAYQNMFPQKNYEQIVLHYGLFNLCVKKPL